MLALDLNGSHDNTNVLDLLKEDCILLGDSSFVLLHNPPLSLLTKPSYH
jgi:hypothetical protein